jgi:predicted ATPase
VDGSSGSCFVGRKGELNDIQGLLGSTRLLTLTGPAGIGKTRLGLQVAGQLLTDYSDGVWLIELGSIMDSVLVPQAVAAVLRVPEEMGQPLIETLRKVVRRRRLPLLLDNCEHLLPACAELAETLLRAGPETRILATSREPLRTGAEAVWRVAPLSLPQPGRITPLAGLERSRLSRCSSSGLRQRSRHSPSLTRMRWRSSRCAGAWMVSRSPLSWPQPG